MDCVNVSVANSNAKHAAAKSIFGHLHEDGAGEDPQTSRAYAAEERRAKGPSQVRRQSQQRDANRHQCETERDGAQKPARLSPMR